MTEGITICLIICGTVAGIAGSILWFIWNDSVNGDLMTKTKNNWKVEEYNRKKREEYAQIGGRK